MTKKTNFRSATTKSIVGVRRLSSTPEFAHREVLFSLRGRMAALTCLPGVMEWVSMDSSGAEANSFSAEGGFVKSLAAADSNDRRDIIVRDRQNGTVKRVSVSTSGVEGNTESGLLKIPNDGLIITFQSIAHNLAPKDTSPTANILLHDDYPVAADPSAAKSDSHNPAYKRGDLSEDTRVTLTIAIAPRKVGTIVNTAQVNSMSPQSEPSQQHGHRGDDGRPPMRCYR